MNSVVSSKSLLYEGHMCVSASQIGKKPVDAKLCCIVPWQGGCVHLRVGEACSHVTTVCHGRASCPLASCQLLWQWLAFHPCAVWILVKQHCSSLLNMFTGQFHMMHDASLHCIMIMVVVMMMMVMIHLWNRLIHAAWFSVLYKSCFLLMPVWSAVLLPCSSNVWMAPSHHTSSCMFTLLLLLNIKTCI